MQLSSWVLSILDAVSLFSVYNRKVKKLSKLVPTSEFWHLNKQPCCLDVRTLSRCVLSSVDRQLPLLMRGNRRSALTVRLFIWTCNSRHHNFGHERLAVTHVLQSAGILNYADGYLLLVFWHFLGIQLSAVPTSARHSLYMWGEMGVVLPHPLARRGAGGEGELAGPSLHQPSCGTLSWEMRRF